MSTVQGEHGSSDLIWRNRRLPDFDDIIVEITTCPIAVNDEDDNLDGAENESSRKMTSFTAPKQFLKEPLRSEEDDDMSGLKQPSKIIERRSNISTAAEYFVEEPLETEDHGKEIEAVATYVEEKKLDDESLSIDDLLATISVDAMLPSVTAAEITRILFERSIEIREVQEGDWYKASILKIPADTKGKAPLKEKFLETRRHNFVSGQPHTAIDLQVLDMLFDIHLFVLEELQEQIQQHGLKWEQESNSRLFEGDKRARGAIIAQTNTNFKSSCWIRTMTLVNGSWVIQEGNDLWQRLTKPVASLELELTPHRQFEDTLAPVSDFFRIIRKRWADVCIGIVQFSDSGRLQPIRSHNFCRDIVAVSTVVDVAVDPATFVGIFRRGLDVQLIPSDSSSSSSSQPDPISPNDGLSQRHLDTALISPNPSISTDSRIFFTIDDTPLGVDQILLPAITPQDFNEPLAQIRASVKQIQTERVQKRDDAEKLKDVLFLHIRSLAQRFTEILDQQDRTYRGLFTHVRQDVQLQKSTLSLDILASQQKLQSQQVALSQVYDDKLTKIQDRQDALSHELMEFRVQAQENYNHLTSQLSELVDYINRGRDDKKGESGSRCGPQPPPEDRGRPGPGEGGSRSGGGSRSEPARKRCGGGSHRRDWRPQPPPDDRGRPGPGDGGSRSGGGSRSEPARKRGGDIDFLVQIRAKVIDEVAKLFNSFSLHRLAVLGSTTDIACKEERVLTWAETDSVQIALQRHEYITTKYRELLLRKFLETRRHNFVSGQPHSATDLQVLDMLSDVHLFVLEELQKQIQQHGLKWERESYSRLFEGDKRDRGAVIARTNTNFKSSCWIRTMALVNETWVIQEGNDLCQRLPKPIDSIELELPPQRQFYDTLGPISEFFKMLHKRWADVCIEAVQFSSFDSLKPVGSHNFCRDIVAVGTVVDFEVDPIDFAGVFRRGTDVHMILSESSSSSSRSTHPDPTASARRIKVCLATFDKKFSFKRPPCPLILASQHKLQSQQVACSQAFDDKLKRIEDRQDALSHELMEFRVQEQENYNHLTSQLSELVDYINRGRYDKKGESGSSRGAQPPPDDCGRPGSGDGGSRSGGGSRSELPRRCAAAEKFVYCSRGRILQGSAAVAKLRLRQVKAVS
ncbi:splicing factor 3B subunit 1-like [Dorcoceras hygrometricum]|uniref:Splicing factor 3B subunit 1-like n=1 Tax=Dorcoceras hygrometricum TaxID=472368 RepID=A0A2Z7BUS4_9LAMI|nr:splicing factor 3B subunit 1-like [Dorcoceras hygrometricum]